MKQLNLLKKLWGVLEAEDRRNFIFLFVIMIIGTLVELVSVGIIVPVFAIIGDIHFISKYPRVWKLLGDPNYSIIVISTMVILFGIYLFKALFLSFSAFKQSKFIYSLSARISSKLFSIYLRQPYEFHLRQNSAQLIRNTTTDVVMMSTALQALIVIITETTVLLGLFLLLIFVEPFGAVISLSVLIFSAGGFYLLTKTRITKWGKANHYHAGKRFQHLQQGFGASKDTLIFGRTEEFIQQFNFHNFKMALFNERQYTMSQLPKLFIESLAIMGLVIIVIAKILIDNDISSLLPILALFATAAFRLMPSVNRVLGSIQAVQYGLPSIETVYDEINKLTEFQQTSSLGMEIAFKKKLSFEKVSFKFASVPDLVLREVSLSIYIGESIGIIGGSGAGKSTFIDLLLGLLKPIAGDVLVDGVNIQNNLRSWQNQIGYVPQTIYLTDDSLKKNIAFGLSDEAINDEAITKAVYAAQLDGFIKSLPEGLDTEVGERGVRLSGGQRQRIGIARALYHDPKILVLDESTSALDNKTEAEVMESIKALQGEKTIIIVAHRLTTIKHCDRIFRFENGEVVDSGNTKDILSKVIITESNQIN